MLNGHFLTDNVYSAMYMFGQDFGIDMDLIERIEIVRGPSSALYGSNGMFATINIFTRAPADSPRAYLTTELGSFGEQKALISTSAYLGNGANLLLSASGFRTGGRTITAPELNGAQTGKSGAEQGYHTFAQLTWRNWNVMANFNQHKAIVPSGWFGADFGDTGTYSRDTHNFVEAALTKPVGLSGEIQWRIYYDQYRYYGRYDYTDEGVTRDERDFASGDWLGTRFSYRFTAGKLKNLAFGSQFDADVRNLQATEQVSPVYYRHREASYPDQNVGIFAHYAYDLSKSWTLYSGLRFDDAGAHPSSLSPRLAAVWKRPANTSYKFMYGSAFRNPSTFEQYWEPSPGVESEKINTFEFSREQRIAGRIDLVGSLFHYRLTGLIEGVPTETMTLQYRNMSKGQATGAEVEINGKFAAGAELSANISFQNAKYTDPERSLPNSPSCLAMFRASLPAARNHLIISPAVRYMSSRLSPYGFRLRPVALADLTATTNRLSREFDVQFGIRNLTGRVYSDPLSMEHLIQVMPRSGRSVFVKLIWHYGD
jgi:iron complex outermembrane receptor protein